MEDTKGYRIDLYIRLSLMMFLQFAVWGAWSVMIAGHMEYNLHFSGKQISYIFGTTAFGSIISPLIAGWIADRYMPNQIFTAIMHLAGAALLYYAWKIAAPVPKGEVAPFWPLWTTMFVYAATYMPTIALTNAIAFHHMGDSNKFGTIRVWGTIGWIAVQSFLAWFVARGLAGNAELQQPRMHDCLLVAAVAALLMGIYCFTLPNTPPAKNAGNPYAFLEAFSLMKNRNFAILLITSFVVAIELPFYYNLTYLFLTEKSGVGLEGGPAQLAMTLGQWGELFLMFLIYPSLKYLGMRWTIFLGILAWPVRYAIFSVGHPDWLVIASQTLHGICYSFFFVGGMIAAEKLSPKDIRASTQSLMLFMTNGLGMLVGHFVSGRVHDYYKLPGDAGHHWPGIFMVPIVVTVVAGLFFITSFREKEYKEEADRIAALPDPTGVEQSGAVL